MLTSIAENMTIMIFNQLILIQVVHYGILNRPLMLAKIIISQVIILAPTILFQIRNMIRKQKYKKQMQRKHLQHMIKLMLVKLD